MMRQNSRIIIGLTTFNHEFLQISVAGLARISKKVSLIIYNDNPCRTLKHHDVRKLGFRGRLHIINTCENVGVFRARVAILEYIHKNKISVAAPVAKFGKKSHNDNQKTAVLRYGASSQTYGRNIPWVSS